MNAESKGMKKWSVQFSVIFVVEADTQSEAATKADKAFDRWQKGGPDFYPEDVDMREPEEIIEDEEEE